MLDRTVRALATLTRQVAVVQYPSLSRSAVRHVELVPLVPGRLLVVLITDTGRVEQRSVEVDPQVTDQLVGELRARLNASIGGRRLDQVGRRCCAETAEAFRPEDRAWSRSVVTALEDALSIQREDRVVLAGTAHLARSPLDFPQSIGPVLEAIEEQVVLLRLLGEMADDPASGVVGAHRPRAAPPGPARDLRGDQRLRQRQRRWPALGVLGPTRMDYPTTMAAVRAVARYVSRIIGG